MISVKRCPATSLSASHNHHHNHHQNQQHSHHNPHSHSHRIPPVQIRSSSAGRAASNSCNSGSNSKRFGRSRNNSLYVNGTGITGYCSSGESTGGGDSGNSYSIITNGGSLYYNGSSSHHSVLGVKTRAGGDIFEFDSLFLVPKCALTYDKAMSLRKDLAAYDFNIRILEDTPKGNVWISGNRDASVQKQSRPASANKDHHPHSVNHTLHWFACVGEDSNGFSNEEELQKEREERIKQIKERQNEERQRKLEELKAQALAAQKFREQKEEERRRRMDDLRRRENDRRSQVEERRRAIQEADNERRQYILQKNQERDQRMETKRRNERSSIQFAFGSSTPRMIDTSDSGMCSSLWAHRRATSITNVAYTGAPLTRRSSERELTDGSSKKRATSASGLDRSTDEVRRMSSSMYEVFNWASTSECPKKLTLSLAGSGINIDEPPSRAEGVAAKSQARKGRAFSMTRLDQLAQPRRRNGEHISAIVERERRQMLELENMARLSLSSSRSSPTADGSPGKRMSRSMCQLASAGSTAKHLRNQSQDSHHSGAAHTGRKSSFNSSLGDATLRSHSADTSKSMSQLNTAGRTSRLTKTERLRQQVREQLNGNQTLAATGATVHSQPSLPISRLRSGEITPNSMTASRPGSAMSSSTTASGVVYRRSLPASVAHQRKPRPASIAVTGVSAGLKEEKPPIPKASTANNSSSTSLERKRSQSGTSTPVKPALASDSARKHQAEKQRISSARGTPKASSTPLQSPGPEKANRTLHDTLQQQKQKQKQQPMSEEQLLQQQQQRQLLFKEDSLASVKSTEPEVSEQQYEPHEQDDGSMQSESVATTVVESLEQPLQKAAVENKPHEVSAEVSKPPKQQELEVSNHEEKRDEMKENTAAANNNTLEPNQQPDGSNGDLMTASMIAKRITTEEQAKAALAERRRLAREEAERQAELERQRIAAEEEAERQRQMEEEERLRMLELETNRLLEEQRRLEEERLQQAIQEAEKREEEERLRREEEARQKIEREEAERKAREEAERQRIEMDERLKKEEKEREERRKRVEAIMSRTRAKGSANNTPTKQSEENKDNAMSKSHIVTSNTPMAIVEPTMSMTESMLGGSLDLPQQAMQTITEGAPSQGEPSVTSVTEPVETLAQEIQSLSIVDQQQSQQNNNNDSSINNNHNSNDKSNSGSATSADSASFERSVTEKENLLLGSFNKNLNASNGGGSDNSSSTSNSSGSQQLLTLESSPATTNGKAASGGPTIAETTELIIEDAIKSGQTNGHKNGSIDNVFTQNPPVVDGTTKLLAHLTDNNSHVADFVALTSTVDVDGSENLLDVSSSTHATTTSTASSGPVVGQLIDFSSFQTLTTDEIQQQNAATIVNADPFNLNNNNTNSTSVNLVDSSSNGTSTTSFSTSLFSSANDANLISNSNFLNNNTTRLVATSDSQDNRDLSLL
ncbi:plectin isoform X6 [Toxorhynchites rutilus septentrionalis]|uniref:plectin isoform X6 n=1 Tax=Toxorhynchites rutilus septentrionalis TaxID=329112 RepID=UPI0024798170|nr:plectin isoform X6 [Toxorhynchites rutilus septentrionalis]